MDINIKGHHVEVTESLRETVLDKLGHLDKYDHEITNIDVFLTVEKERQTATATVNIPHISLHAEATTDDMYSAIDELEQKLKKQITEHKRKLEDKIKHGNANKRG